MLVMEKNWDYMAEVEAFAEKTGQMKQLQEKLDYLATFGGDPGAGDVRCTLYKDFAPMSFTFVMEKCVKGIWKRWFNGGLIYHGSHDGGGDGGSPTYSVNLIPQQGWSIHT